MEPTDGNRWGVDGRYKIERHLGRGGMGSVYAATDTLLGRQVALKVLDSAHSDDEGGGRKRILREAGIAARVEHERIARVYDVGEHEGSPFIAMEFVRGVTLRTWMTARRDKPGGYGAEGHDLEVLRIVTQILEGLAAMHSSGVVHRDLKPENIMLASGSVKVLDFGLARTFVMPERSSARMAVAGAPASSSIGLLSGTPGYMAPEQCEGAAVDQRADVFALGVIVYELVAGRRPFEANGTLEVLELTLRSEPGFSEEPWTTLPELTATVRRMLARDPAHRFSDASSVLSALAAILPPLSSTSLLPTTQSRELGEAPTILAVPIRRNRAARGVLSILAVLAVVVGVAGARRWALLRAAHANPPPGMVLVPGGNIPLGHTRAELDRECAEVGPGCNRQKLQREMPKTTTDIPAFFLDAREVTNAEMTEFLNVHIASLVVTPDEDDHYPRYVRFNQGLRQDGEYLFDLNRSAGIAYTSERVFQTKPGRDALPASHVTWFGAELFCRTHGKRLPTEDQWETAARGADDRPYPWGSEAAHCGGVVLPADGMIRMDPDCPATVQPGPVGQSWQDVTPDGVHDLGGNVGEWTDSGYVEDDRLAYPIGSGSDFPRVIRGGSWVPQSSYLSRSSGRTGRPAAFAAQNIGFRCARSLKTMFESTRRQP